MSLLAALALGLGGYGLLLQWRRGPVPTAEAQAGSPPLFALPEVTRLERLHEAAPAAAQISVAPRRHGHLSIELTGLTAAGLPKTAGVAVIATDTGVQLAWLPLRQFAVDGNTARTEIDAPAMPLRLLFAARPTAALRSWWTATTCSVQADAITAAQLDATVHAVNVEAVFRGETGPLREVPFSLRRAGVADWHYVADNGAVDIIAAAGGRMQLQLAAGDYLLAPLVGTTGEPFGLRVLVAGPVHAEFTR